MAWQASQIEMFAVDDWDIGVTGQLLLKHRVSRHVCAVKHGQHACAQQSELQTGDAWPNMLGSPRRKHLKNREQQMVNSLF